VERETSRDGRERDEEELVRNEPSEAGSPDRGTGQRQDHRAAPPGHRLPGEPPNAAEGPSDQDD
jgi:hypothetical protein